MLAHDPGAEVRMTAGRGDSQRSSGLTGRFDPAKNTVENLVVSRDSGSTVAVSIVANIALEIERLESFFASRKVVRMTDRTEHPKSAGKQHKRRDDDSHLPDLIVDQVVEEIADLPRPGVPKDVLNVTKADHRFPDVLIGD